MTTSPKKVSSLTDPFQQGLDRGVVLRLLAGNWTRSDYQQYLRTDHWQEMKARAFDYQGGLCTLCDSPSSPQIHHRPCGYGHLFREDVRMHLTLLCRKCHRRQHRK